MAKNPRSRRRATSYDWGEAPGFHGTFTRGWTKDLEDRTLFITVNPVTWLLGFDSLVTTPTAVRTALKYGFPAPGPGMVDVGEMDLAWMLRSTFRRIRSSIFYISVQVTASFDGPRGEAYEETCTARTIVEFPFWIKATEKSRMRYFKDILPQVPGSRYTDVNPRTDERSFIERGQTDSRGILRNRQRRRRASVPQRQSPPDLFWTIVYAIWGALDRCVGKLQGQGRSYLQRIGLFRFYVDNIFVKQVIQED